MHGQNNTDLAYLLDSTRMASECAWLPLPSPKNEVSLSELRAQIFERLDEQWLMLRQLLQWTEIGQLAQPAGLPAHAMHSSDVSMETARHRPLRFNPEHTELPRDHASPTIALRAPKKWAHAAESPASLPKRRCALPIRSIMEPRQGSRASSGASSPKDSHSARSIVSSATRAESDGSNSPEHSTTSNNSSRELSSRELSSRELSSKKAVPVPPPLPASLLCTKKATGMQSVEGNHGAKKRCLCSINRTIGANLDDGGAKSVLELARMFDRKLQQNT
ncbi:hypothetical protein GGI25_003049 [Coemansia spiralis]|uniref:Uncharacterized protein n=2 Tax=Coemansia TaxID=4863 RepID=A0A9W8G9H8_9FUNG|nr:hypothetical protein EDC05_002954 [Coemansia umbellata]KAJ2622054.1 hypothetical protein GGI26_003630 [Coemansia sp. RSA 1358]KAJ2677659.1 hypothetical protein GGI25_003049 [Coemansia spiralis]